jgi:photosystem II stability/assembly factor-like uncharacterized protein
MKSFKIILFCLMSTLIHAQSVHTTNFDLNLRNIGPANPGGRVVDIEAHPDDFTKVYVASASGGVWKSTNAGTTWQPIFDKYETASIGDIAIDPMNKNTLWVGTGEANNRNSVSWGNGIYKSTDGGKTFENKGLQSTQQISRVLVNPKNSDDVCVCAIGHLWGYTGDRGLFRTKDGGKSWNKKTNGLPNDGKTGCTDLVRDSKNPNILYAAFYHRLRKPWNFFSGGEQGGIFKSTDGGETWKKLTNGLPSGATGRIGLAIYEKNPNILMAIVEAKRSDTLATPGSGIYRSENGGQTWTYINTYNNRPFYYSQIRINPMDDKRVYVLTTRFMVSEDGGKTFKDGSADQEVHGDFHALWLDPKNKDRYYLGADKGFSLTHDHGSHFQLIDNLPITQYYSINYDMQEPYIVYGGLQDNGSFATPSFSRDARGILNDHNWKMHWGDGQEAAVNPFDPNDAYTGMENGHYFKYNPQTRELKQISPSFYNVLNFNDYFKTSDTIKDVMRFNWSTPFALSPNDPSTIYMAGNHVYKSTNKGMQWTIISPDLSSNDRVKRKDGVSGGITPDNTGAETHCTVSSLSISSISDDIIWAGTDDGQVQVTKDGGKSWQNLTAKISSVTQGLWVSKVEASKFHPGRAYVTFDGHRSDDFGTYIFITDDYGSTWNRINSGLTEGEVVRTLKEDHINENLLFVGTETGVWYSLDKGNSWTKLKGLPTVSVYDLKIHPRDNDLIIGSHGRGIWIVDDISPLQQMSADITNKVLHIFEQKPTTLWHNVSRGGQRGHFSWAGGNPANIKNTSSIPRAEFKVEVPVTFYIGSDKIDSVQIKISHPSSKLVYSNKIKVNLGINRFFWNREFDSPSFEKSENDWLMNFLKENIKKDNTNTLSNMSTRFARANSPAAKRRVFQSMIENYLISPIDQKYGISEAGPGIYQVEIYAGDKVAKSHVVIKNDPLGN